MKLKYFLKKILYDIDYAVTKLRYHMRYRLRKKKALGAYATNRSGPATKGILKYFLILFISISVFMFAFIPYSLWVKKSDGAESEENAYRIRNVVINLDRTTEQGESLDLNQIGDLDLQEDHEDVTRENGTTNSATTNTNTADTKKETKPKHTPVFTTYKVQKGDTIWKIAKNNGLRLDTIIGVNRKKITDVANLAVGLQLNVPDRDGVNYTVRKNDTLSKISARYNAKIETIMLANTLTNNVINRGNTLFVPGARLTKGERNEFFGIAFIRPVYGRVTSPYGFRTHPITKKYTFHQGIDIGRNNRGTIKASEAGKVVFAGRKGGYGNFVAIKHRKGFTTRYGHMRSINVRVGQKVQKGTVIGRVGSTGRSTGPHLHFEVMYNNKFVNPKRYVRF